MLKKTSFAVACASALFTHATVVNAQWKPSKSVEFVAPATPGGGYDTLARAVHKVLQESKLTVTPVTVVNKPGGGGGIGWRYVAQHVGDAHVIAVASSTLLTNDITGINTFKWTDLTPLAVIATEYLVYSVRTDHKVKGIRELMDAVRANPKAINFATAPGPGNANHILMGMMAKAINVNVTQIPLVFFPSAAESTTAALGGHVDVVISSIPPVLEQVRAGKMRILAVGAPQRLTGALANVPTFREAGANAVFINWRGVVGPANLAKDQIAYWEQVFAAMSKTEAWKTYSENTLSIPTFMDSANSTRFLQAQHGETRIVMQELGIAK